MRAPLSFWGNAMSGAYALFSLAVIAQQAPDRPLEVRVGIVAYQDFQHELKSYKKELLALAKESKFRFRLAPGTYAEVLHWMERGLIDVAVMSPGVFAETQKAKVPVCRYLATLGHPPAKSPLALAERKKPGPHYQYQAACVVAADSSLHNSADLKKAAAEGSIQFLFVDRLSVSGRILPEYVLKQIGIEPTRDQVEYTYSHS